MPLILYIKDNCPHASSVLERVKHLSTNIEVRNIRENRFAHELIQQGGKFQSPCLIDAQKEVCIYESKEIISYIDRFYGGKTA